MIKTSVYGLKLTEFQDTMGDEVAFSNYNFNVLEDELFDTQSILEELTGEDFFENAKSISDREAILEKEYGGVNLLRGTYKKHYDTSTATYAEKKLDFWGTGVWEDGNFVNTSTNTNQLSLKEFTEAGIETEGRPLTEIDTYLHFTGDNINRPLEGLKQTKIPMQNIGKYTVSFYARNKESNTETALASRNGEKVRLRVAVLPTGGTISEGNYIEVEVSNFDWTKYICTFEFENANTSTYYNSNVTTVDADDTQIFGVLRDFILEGNINNELEVCGLSIQQGEYSHDWDVNPFDVFESYDLLQKQIGNLDDLKDYLKGTLTTHDNLVDALNAIYNIVKSLKGDDGLTTAHTDTLVGAINELDKDIGDLVDIKHDSSYKGSVVKAFNYQLGLKGLTASTDNYNARFATLKPTTIWGTSKYVVNKDELNIANVDDIRECFTKNP